MSGMITDNVTIHGGINKLHRFFIFRENVSPREIIHALVNNPRAYYRDILISMHLIAGKSDKCNIIFRRRNTQIHAQKIGGTNYAGNK